MVIVGLSIDEDPLEVYKRLWNNRILNDRNYILDHGLRGSVLLLADNFVHLFIDREKVSSFLDCLITFLLVTSLVTNHVPIDRLINTFFIRKDFKLAIEVAKLLA